MSLAASIALCVLGIPTLSQAQPAHDAIGTNEVRIVEAQGTVEVSPAGATRWILTLTNQTLRPFDRLRTGPNSRAALQWSDRSVVSIGASTEIEILPPHRADAQAGLHLVRGILSFFHRDEPGRIRVITRGAIAGVEGTEFVISQTDDGKDARTLLSVLDGKVQFGNGQATLVVTNGQQAVVDAGAAPVRTAGFVANNVLQWFLYYPAVLDLSDLTLTSEERSALAASIAEYRDGDLLSALAKYPADRVPASDAERIYYAALVLSVGEVGQAETNLANLEDRDLRGRPQRLASALRELISIVKRQPVPKIADPKLATEFLAQSYYEQAFPVEDSGLIAALEAARQAVSRSPQFGFALERVAELEFSFGRSGPALEALNASLKLTPRTAQALALKGFLLAARNRSREAIAWFDRALSVDSALGNAWLGRGLCRIRLGQVRAGQEDLLMAAALEPQRAELRSYLGKGYAKQGDFPRAFREFQIAKSLDPNDPTAWLYSALAHQQKNEINQAIRDLERSQKLNDNRSVYRSRLLLEQDQAVRSANLASVYQDAGMSDVAIREAGRAVNYDYANFSAHLFLANSYNDLRDPNLSFLRYDTATENEYLLADLLAPVNAGTISSTVSQHEYSPLFAQNGLGVASSTEYLSRGAWTEAAAQFGTIDNTGYDFEAFYRSDPGLRENNDVVQRQFVGSLKQQLTPHDTISIRIKDYQADGGDLAEYYNPEMANPSVRFDEDQGPSVGVGYHHEWTPGIHTLFFGTWLTDTLTLTNPFNPTIVVFQPFGPVTAVQGITMQQRLRNELEVYSAELQQIFQQPEHNTILGARFQYGHFDTHNLQDFPSTLAGAFPDPPTPAADQDVSSVFRRVSVYGYHQWQIIDPLQLIGGFSYDWLRFPENSQLAPVSGAERSLSELSPKAGLIWTPLAGSAVRFAYTRSLTGVSAEQSYVLEPSQVAGFIQSYRSVIPESVVGPIAGAKIEAFDLSLEQKFATGTYLGIAGELLNSDVDRVTGSFDLNPSSLGIAVPGSLREDLDYQEKSLLLTVNQLIRRDWSIGARYRISKAILNDQFVDIPKTVPVGFTDFQPRQRLEGILQQLNLFVDLNHPTGFFARGEAVWYSQSNSGYNPAEAGDDLWQFNAFAGYRFLRRRAELTLGLLNLTDQDYRLNPLNIYNEPPRERTIMAQFQFRF